MTRALANIQIVINRLLRSLCITKGPPLVERRAPPTKGNIYSIARMGTSEPVRAPPEVSRTCGHKLAKPRSDRIVIEFRALKSAISGSTMGLGGKIMGVSFAARLHRGSTRTCSAACFRRAHARCVCVPSPSTGSGHRKCGNATDRGRRCTDATRGLFGSSSGLGISATTTATAPTTTATTELAPQPVTASEKSQKAAASQNRRDRG
jgi:hypothetical protein